MPLYGPDGRPLNTPHTPQPQQSQEKATEESGRRLQWLKKSLAGLVAFATIIGFAIAVYMMRPVLIPSSIENSASFSPEQARLTITDNGQLAMRDVEFSCESKKIVFADTHTLNPSQFVILFTQRTIPIVEPGEQFRVDCIQAWHLYVADNRTNGILAFGDISPKESFQFIWAFDILPNNSIRVTHNPTPGDRLYSSNPDPKQGDLPITGVDMEVKVSYSLFFGVKLFEKRFRYITRAEGNSLTWVLVPETYPSIPSGKGGLDFVLNGGPTNVTLVSK